MRSYEAPPEGTIKVWVGAPGGGLEAGLCHVQQEKDWEERGLFQHPVIMASCFHSLFNKPLSLSLSSPRLSSFSSSSLSKSI